MRAETTKDNSGSFPQYMYYNEHVRDNNEEFEVGSFGKETDFEAVDIKIHLILKARVAYTARVTFWCYVEAIYMFVHRNDRSYMEHKVTYNCNDIFILLN